MVLERPTLRLLEKPEQEQRFDDGRMTMMMVPVPLEILILL